MYRLLFIGLLAIWGVEAQLENHINCLQSTLNATAPRLPNLSLQFLFFQNELTRLRSRLRDCRDNACGREIEADVDTAYFRFITDDLLNVETGHGIATAFDTTVNRCSSNRPSSLLYLRTQTPVWCFLEAVFDLWQQRPELETIRYVAHHNLRYAMANIRNCGADGTCVKRWINTADNEYFVLFADLLIGQNGSRLATRANYIVDSCTSNYTTQVQNLLKSPIICYHSAATNVSARFENLSPYVVRFVRELRDTMTEFWICNRNSTCIDVVETKGRTALGAFIDQIRPVRNGDAAIQLINTVIDQCRQIQGGPGGGGGGGSGSGGGSGGGGGGGSGGSSGGNQTQNTTGNVTIECFRLAVSQISRHAPHLSNSAIVAQAFANLIETQNLWRRCSGPSAAICQTNVEATANNIYFHTITNLLLEVQGIEAANLTDRSVNVCNNRRPTRVTPIVQSQVWCYLMAAANVSRDHPQLNFYVQDLVRGLQSSVTNFANCEFHRPCKIAEINRAGTFYEEFARRIRLHPRGIEIIGQSNAAYTTCLRTANRTY